MRRQCLGADTAQARTLILPLTAPQKPTLPVAMILTHAPQTLMRPETVEEDGREYMRHAHISLYTYMRVKQCLPSHLHAKVKCCKDTYPKTHTNSRTMRSMRECLAQSCFESSTLEGAAPRLEGLEVCVVSSNCEGAWCGGTDVDNFCGVADNQRY